jgi:3-hydroxyacyl-CoA dehydrogenase/3a,7a,12a-trihydroxy-5b-cholest-24-enoyl-CoA hydratase
VIRDKTSVNQALLYRLSGDINALHVDPDFARAFGFDRPILHGLCTFGFAARHVIKAMANDDPRYVKSIKVRFSDSVFPGETVETEMWRVDGAVVFRCKVVERDKVVISSAAIELHESLPAAPGKRAPAAPVAAPSANANANAEPTSVEAFHVIRDHLERHADLASKIGKTFLFKLTEPDSAWTVDLKNGPGAVTPGESKADCTLTLADADFRALVAGAADPQKLYFGGKMKISGDVMASQRLMFLKDIDRAKARAVVDRLRAPAGGTAAAAPAAAAPAAAAPAPSKPALAPAIMKALEERLARSPTIAGEVGAVIQLVLTAPAAAFLIDLRSGAGRVRDGKGDADLTLTLSDETLLALARGESFRDHYQRGHVRVDGDARLASKVTFFEGLA